MSKDKKTIKVRDLKPNKDAKGGNKAVNRVGVNHVGVNKTSPNAARPNISGNATH
jgi:hypothetical protein